MQIGHLFTAADLTEVTDKRGNPDRGFMQIFRYTIGEDWDLYTAENNLISNERLVLVFFNIGQFRTEPLTEEVLNACEKMIAFFTERGKDIILRVAYDMEGKGMEKEPTQFALVKEHIEQIGELVSRFGKAIFIYQGLLVGNWAEMHGSKYLKRWNLVELTEILQKKIYGNTFLCVRTPYHYRMLYKPKMPFVRNKADYMGLFDDAILGTDTDMGTFGPDYYDSPDWEAVWSKKREYEFIEQLCKFAPNGGEAIWGEGYYTTLTQEQTIGYLRQLRLTYLNKLYDERLLDAWKKTTYMGKGIWNGRSLYDYVDAHLGYRFHARNVRVTPMRKKGNVKRVLITVPVKNKGFACIYRKCTMKLIAISETGKERIIRTNWDLRNVDTGCLEEFKMAVNFPKKKCKYRLYLEIYRDWDKCPVYFANKYENERIFLGTLSM